MTGEIGIHRAAERHLPRWGAMRYALWPWDDAQSHAEDARDFYLAGHPDRSAFVALDTGGEAVGFAEATLRRDYVEGCDTSPVGFLEGIYVEPGVRGQGIGALLADAVAVWARERGCTEFASNALLDNTDSHAFHAALGFEETERVVFFRKLL